MAVAAVSGGYGSGKFVQEREWTCPDHEHPHEHVCDCSRCDREWNCEKCAVATWVDSFNADGTRKMREVGLYESILLHQLSASVVEHKNILLQVITTPTSTTAALPPPKSPASFSSPEKRLS